VHLPSEKCCGPRLLRGNGINEIYIHDIDSLRGKFPSAGTENNIQQTYNKVLGEEDYILSDIVRKHRLADKRSSEAYVRAGPRSTTHFEPSKVRAGIVTCGGLCPGLNNVIRELVHTLHFLYGANAVIGIRGGYAGFSGKKGLEPIQLTVDNVADIHHQGGTLLASSRGGFDIEAIVAFLKRERLSHLYVVGGDGTHRGAYTISEEVVRRQMNVAVVGIPKTIDNDVDLIDRSFGFTTSVEVLISLSLAPLSLSLHARFIPSSCLPSSQAAQAAIMSAKTEARCNLPNGIGIVKLMGRSAGFIAVHATLASGDVDLCLVRV
jgi:6-phosphofructokinase 1